MAFTVVSNTAKLTMISAISGTDLKAALLNSTITNFTQAESLKTINNWSQLSGIYEVSGTGYTAGGVYLSGVSAYNPTPGIAYPYAYFDGNYVVWPNSTIDSWGMAVYKESTGLIIYLTTFTAPVPKQSVLGEFRVTWSSNHLLQMVG